MCWLGAMTLLLWAGLGLAQDYPFRDPTLPWEQRLDDLIGRLTLGELVLQMARGGAKYNGPAPPIERLGIKPYNWNTECLRGDGEAPGWATAFPQALGLAASFSPELIHRVANATATEVRAKHNYFMSTGNYGDHTGLSCFSPVLNIMRHPLWGRNQETYGEDPFLSAELAVAFVQGLQGDHPRYVKASAGCKHFSVHGGPENVPVSRLSFDAKVSVTLPGDAQGGEGPLAQESVPAGGPLPHSTGHKRCPTDPTGLLHTSNRPTPATGHVQYPRVPKAGASQLTGAGSSCSGTDLETEENDRRDLSLPGRQQELLQDAVAWATGHPVILLLFNAGPLDVGWAQAHHGVGAILACFFPAQATGIAIIKVLLGEEGASPAGRLPATWPAGMDQVPAMENYTMEGRTYRYYGPWAPLYPFGYGLSYTTFLYRDLVLSPTALPLCANLSVSVVVENTGQRDGEEVVQLYLRWAQPSVPVPRWQLVGFRRVPIAAGRAAKLLFLVTYGQRAIWAEQWQLEPGAFTLFVGGQQPGQETRANSEVLQAEFTVTGTTQPLSRC
ncbi:uncharacterized protein ACDP82_017913 [Pangshura tecta]